MSIFGNLKEKTKNWFGGDDFYDDDDVTMETNDNLFPPVEQQTARPRTPAPSRAASNDREHIISVEQKTQHRLMILAPTAFKAGSEEIVLNLRKGHIIMLNLERTPDKDRTPLIAFASGVVKALDGDMKQVAGHAWALTPARVPMGGVVGQLEHTWS